MNVSGPIEPSDIPVARLEWQRDYESGNGLIDMQHRRLFAAVNAMLEAARSGRTPAVIELLDDVITQTMQHFRDEEDVLERDAAHELAGHRKIHMVLLERILTLREGLMKGATPLDEVLDYLADEVVAGHMLCTDRQFFGVLNH